MLARAAKKWDQDAVLVMRQVRKGGEPQTRLTFDRNLSASEIQSIQQSMVAQGIGGWTWGQSRGKPQLSVGRRRQTAPGCYAHDL